MTKFEKFNTLELYKKHKAVEDETGETVRFQKESEDTVFVYAKGRSRYGYRYSAEYFVDNYSVVIVDENEQWHKRINRALKCLRRSGLWPELIEYFNNLSKMTWEDRKSIQKIQELRSRYSTYRRHEDGKMYPQKTLFELKQDAEYSEKIKPFVEKYPFAFYYDDRCELWITSYEYFGERSLVQLKSMYFGKRSNKRVKEELAEAIKAGEEYRFATTVNYDVSVHYEPTNRCYYAEEYRGCGNGHYYLALDASTALFCEND